MKIAVIGAGSSGLVTLKYLLDFFPSEAIFCFEKSKSVRGVWGNQRPDFVSTSTKYTTQFSCFRKWKAQVNPIKNYEEFYRGSEFGDYLEDFTKQFKLIERIHFGIELKHIELKNQRWSLLLNNNEQSFDAVFICTGLANHKAPFKSPDIPITENPEGINNKTVVVIGGGESAADVVNYLAKSEYQNKVYLSLRSGIRVSPRYHPIRGVPSDFLRNRLLLSFDKNLRNWFGEKFVTFRIRFNNLLEKWFPHQNNTKSTSEQIQAKRRAWDMKLKTRAKGELFNVFHNKSDDFLDAVAEDRVEIIGPATDKDWKTYFDFDQKTTLHLNPNLLLFSSGYHSGLEDISNHKIHLKDFYLGCIHTDLPNLFLIGFARPIIGNIPSICEMQAKYTVGLLAQKYKLPNQIKEKQMKDIELLKKEYPSINTDNVYPIEHFTYCDLLAKEMNIMPTLKNVGSFRLWLKIMFTPISTLHYLDEYFDSQEISEQKIYMPPILVGFLSFMKILGFPFTLLKKTPKP